MKILIVANQNTGHFSPFVIEQVDSLTKLGVEFEYFGIMGKGPLGYLRNLPALIRKIREFKPDIVHAHYGLSGLLAVLQRKIPVVITYHGSDIHGRGKNLVLSRFAMMGAAFNIFVTEALKDIAGYKRGNCAVIPCGINISGFVPEDRIRARESLGWDADTKYILFAGAFDREVKNAPLAKSAVALIDGAELVELKGFDRKGVRNALSASDCLLMTSHNEGSPQIIKEAMACGTPIVSVDVGDVKDVIGTTEGCYLAGYDAEDIASKIRSALLFEGKTDGRKRLYELGLANELVAKRVLEVYRAIIKEK